MITTTIIILLFIAAGYLAYVNYKFQLEKRATEKRRGKYLEEYENQSSRIVECYIDDLGNKWLMFENLTALPAKRAIEGGIMSRHAELCLTPELFDEYMNTIFTTLTTNVNKQKAAEEVLRLVARIQERRTWAAETHTVEALANVYFMLEGEDPKDTSNYWFDKKKEIWAKDSKCHAFFLQSAFSTMRGFKDLSNTGIPSYLAQKAAEEALSQSQKSTPNGGLK